MSSLTLNTHILLALRTHKRPRQRCEKPVRLVGGRSHVSLTGAFLCLSGPSLTTSRPKPSKSVDVPLKPQAVDTQAARNLHESHQPSPPFNETASKCIVYAQCAYAPIHDHIPSLLATYLLTYLPPTYLPTYLPASLRAYLAAYLHTYPPTHLPAYLPTHLPTL